MNDKIVDLDSELKPSKYDIKILGVDSAGEAREITADFYSIVENLDLSSPVEHALKKGFMIGKRSGGKTYEQDLNEMIWSLKREQLQRIRRRGLK